MREKAEGDAVAVADSVKKRRDSVFEAFVSFLFVICCFCFLRGKRKGQWSGVIFVRSVGHSWYGPLQFFFFFL